MAGFRRVGCEPCALVLGCGIAVHKRGIIRAELRLKVNILP